MPGPVGAGLFGPEGGGRTHDGYRLPRGKGLVLFNSTGVASGQGNVSCLVRSYGLLTRGRPRLGSSLDMIIFNGRSRRLGPLLPFGMCPLGCIDGRRRLMSICGTISLFIAPSLRRGLPGAVVRTVTYKIPYVNFGINNVPRVVSRLRGKCITRCGSSRSFTGNVC